MSDDTTKIMCASDRFFFRHVPVMLNSAISNTEGAVEIVILTKDIGIDEKNEIRRLFPNVPIQFFDIDSEAVKDLTYKFALSPMSYARILMSDLVNWEKFVYLDIDVIVQRDLRILYNTELGQHPVAGVLRDGQLNAGVLVINAALWRSERLAGQILDYAREHQPKDADQAAIEGVIGDRILALNKRWNTLVDPVWGAPVQNESTYLDDAWIVHYLTGFKPWNLGRWLLPTHCLKPWDRHRMKSTLPRMLRAELRLFAWQVRILGLRLLGRT